MTIREDMIKIGLMVFLAIYRSIYNSGDIQIIVHYGKGTQIIFSVLNW